MKNMVLLIISIFLFILLSEHLFDVFYFHIEMIRFISILALGVALLYVLYKNSK